PAKHMVKERTTCQLHTIRNMNNCAMMSRCSCSSWMSSTLRFRQGLMPQKVKQLEDTVKALQQELADIRTALQKATDAAKGAADAADAAQTTADNAISGELKALNVAGGGKINGQLIIDVSALPAAGGKRRNALRLVTHPDESDAV